MKRFENRRDVVEFRSLRNSPSSRVENKLKAIQLIARKVEEERVAVVKFGEK